MSRKQQGCTRPEQLAATLLLLLPLLLWINAFVPMPSILEVEFDLL
jgi:hypothetical protein